jgi:hypothetical protein
MFFVTNLHITFSHGAQAMQSAQIPIELSEAKIKKTVDDTVKRFSSDIQGVSDLSLLNIYLNSHRSQLVGMWLLLIAYPHLTAYIDQKTKELDGIYELAEARIKSGDLGRSPASSSVEVGQESNQNGISRD